MSKNPLKYCPVLSQSEHNRLDNNRTNFTVQTCTELSLPLISECCQRKLPSFESLFSYHTPQCADLSCTLWGPDCIYMKNNHKILSAQGPLWDYHQIKNLLLGLGIIAVFFFFFAGLLFLSLYASLSFFPLWFFSPPPGYMFLSNYVQDSLPTIGKKDGAWRTELKKGCHLKAICAR